MQLQKVEYTGPALFREIEGIGKVYKGAVVEVPAGMVPHLVKSGQFREVKPPAPKKKLDPPPKVDLVKPKKADAEKPAGGEE